MKDFDQEKKDRAEATRADREFMLGGQRFYAEASVRPEVMLEFEQIESETPPSEVLRIVDGTIVAMIEDSPDASGVGGHERYLALRKTSAIGMDDLLALANWLVGAATGRPTEQPVVSSALPAMAGTTSTGDSSSEDSTEG